MTDESSCVPSATERRISFMNIVGYACVNFLGGGSTVLISAWLMFFYTTMCGITAVEASLIFTSARILDAVLNPVMGFISDNFYKTRLGQRFGRRRFFILIGIPAILMIFPGMWIPGMSLAYYWVINFLYEICFTMVIVSCICLPAEMSRNAADKAVLTGGKQMCGIVASTIASFIPGIMFKIYGDSDPLAFFMTGVIYGVMIALSLVVVWLFTYERDPREIHVFSHTETVSGSLVSILSNVKQALKLRAYRLHCIMLVMGCIYKNLATGIFAYFVVLVLFRTPEEAAGVLTVTQITSFAALCLCIWMCYRLGAPRTYRLFSIVVAVGCLGYYLLTEMIGSYSFPVLLYLVAIINFCGRAGIDYVPVFQLQFMADIDEIVHGERREGIFSGVNTLFSRAATGVETMAIGVGLSFFGYTEGTTEQSDFTQFGITIICIAMPICFLFFGWLASNGLHLTRETHGIVCQEVARLKAGGRKEEVRPEVRAVVEDLTGLRYEKCWTIKVEDRR